MRILFLGAAAVALSGCSWLGLGNNNRLPSYQNYGGQYAGQQAYRVNQSVNQSGCTSGNCLARWNLEGAVGPSFTVNGDAIDGDLVSPTSGANIRNISMSEAFETGYRAELGGSYAVTPNQKLIGNVFLEEADSEGTLDLGTIGGQELRGGLSDYRTYGAELGVRQYFRPFRAPVVNSVRPYIQGRVGLARVESIDLENTTLGGAAFSGGDIPLYDSDWVGSASGTIGIETPLTRFSTIALETGLRYVQSPNGDNSVLSPPNPLAGINQSGSRTSIPIMLRGRYRF